MAQPPDARAGSLVPAPATPALARTGLPALPWVVAVVAAASAFGLVACASPALGLGAAFGLVYAAVSVLDVRVGLCLFVVIAFLDVLPVPIGPAVSLTKVAGLVLALAWLATVTTSGRSRPGGLLTTHPGATWLLAALVAWAAASVAWAGSPGAAISATYRYALNAALFVIVYSVVRTPRSFRWVIAAYVFGAAMSAAYGIVHQPSSGAAGLERVAGTIGDANEFAAVLVSALPLAIALAATATARRVRALGLFAIVLCAAGIALSLSRGGLLAVLVMLVAAVLVAGRWRGIVAAIGAAIVLAGAGYFLLAAPLAARERVSSSGTGTGRTDLWRVGWRMVADRPVLGVGAGNYATASLRYLLRPGQLSRSDLIANTPKVAHNTYLHVTAELGILGALAFLGLIGFALSCGLRAAHAFERSRDGPLEMFSRAWLVAMAGVLAADLFLSAEFSKQLWFLLALGPCLLAMARERAWAT
jgi:O-antigen ligase